MSERNISSAGEKVVSATMAPPKTMHVPGNFKFQKVDEFYHELDTNPAQWIKIQTIETISLVNISDSENDPTNDQILLTLKDTAGIMRYMAIDFITADIFRLRFNPSETAGYYTEVNTATSVQDTYAGLRKTMKYYTEKFPGVLTYKPYINFDVGLIEETRDFFRCKTLIDSKTDILNIEIDKKELTISVKGIETGEEFWSCNLGKTCFSPEMSYPNPEAEGETLTDYAVVVSVSKPATAKYIGFGEKGGTKLCKNSKQLSYFNFDNMRYKSVYGIGAQDSREPLYHSNSFFLEFYGTPATKKGVHGTFVNSPSQVLMDMGHTYSDQLRIATMYGDMDLAVFIGADSKEVLGKYTTISGKARLKPRYVLGYHQGGYGYEDTQAMLDVVNGYGDSDVPFDGLHVDVDVQNYYRTFTMNEDKYRRICLGKDGKTGPIFDINSDNTVLLERQDGYGNHIEAIYPDGAPVKAIKENGELFEARYVDGHFEPWYNEDGTKKKVGQFLFEYLLGGHKTWTKGYNLKVKCSTNITPVVSNPYVMQNNDKAGVYRTLKSGLDGEFFVKYRKVIKDVPENRATFEGSNYSGTFLGGVYYGRDAEGRELGSFGHYPDFGKRDTRIWWGQQYKDLLKAGLSMIWQDMTTPAISINQYLQEEGESWFNFKLWNGERDITKGGAPYKNLCCSYKSLPFNLLLTDDFDKRYKRDGYSKKLSPEGKIRNLYSYNLHKATYHGISNIWKINEMSFTWVILNDKALAKVQSKDILDKLLAKGTILEQTISTFSFPCYIVISSDIRGDVESALNGTEYYIVADQVCQVLYDSKALQKRFNERNFIIGRGGFSGLHRYAGLWTGDNASTWEFLKINVAQMLALGLSGQPIAGSDIGGFENPEDGGGKWADPELVTRWTILGAFLPWFRNHYRRKGTKEFQELYKFQDYASEAPANEQFMYYSILPVSRIYIKLRYQLMQLFYDLMFENTITGMPIARPLFLQDEQDTQLFNDKILFLNEQFLIGKDLMVAPIMDKQRDLGGGNYEAKRDIYFPTSSCWYQFLHNRKPLASPVQGGTTVEYDAAINSSCQDPNSDRSLYVLPLYVREGGILPMTESERYVGAYYEDNGESMPITINIYPSPNQKVTDYSMYLDDGKSRSSAPSLDASFGGDPEANDEYRRVDIKHMPDHRWNRTIKIDRKYDGIDAATYKICPYYFLALLHDPDEPIITKNGIAKDKVCEIKVNGKTVPFFAATDNGDVINEHFNNSDHNNWYFNTALNASFIKVFEEESIEVTFTNI
jgi:alpha-glucosidase (family GH31 glycosyl hydrolase)